MIKTIRKIVKETLDKLDMNSVDALELIMRTGKAETGYRALMGYGKGNPALGFWQVEPATMFDTWENYVMYRPKIRDVLWQLGLNDGDMKFSLLTNIALQAAFCRLKYRRDSNPIPPASNMVAQAEYWKRVYNSELGRGTIEHFLKANDYEQNN